MKQSTTGLENPHTTPFPRSFLSISTQLRYGPIIYVFLALLLMAFFLLWHSLRAQQNTLLPMQQKQGEAVAFAITNHLQRQREDLESAAQLMALTILDDTAQTMLLSSIPQHGSGNKHVMMVDNAGELLAFYPDDRPSNTINAPDIQNVLTANKSAHAVFTDGLSGEPVMITGITLREASGAAKGVLLLQTDIAFLQEILARHETGAFGYAYMLDRTRGWLLYIDADTDQLVQRSTIDHPYVADFVAGTAAPAAGWSRILQTPVYRGLFGDWTLRQVTAVPLLNADVVSEIPIAEAYAPIRAMIRMVAILLLCATVGALAMGSYFSQKFVTPLNQLTTAAMQISEGNLTIHLPVHPRNELGLLATTFNHMTAQLQETVNDLEKSVEERTGVINRRSSQIQAAAATARDATSATDLAELLDRAVNLVPSRFGYYHAGIFLVDEAGKYAVLRAATGPVGQTMLQRQHRLRVGIEGIVGRVIQTGIPYITPDTSQDTVYWPNPLLPETRSEMGLPLQVDDRVIGAMNVQSKDVAAFDHEDVTILQTLTDQLAVAIEKTRLFEKTQAMLTERLHTIVSNVPLILFAFDRQGIVTLAEGKGLVTLGVESIPFAQQSVFDVFYREPIILADIRRALQGEAVNTTVTLRGFTWDVRYIPVFDETAVFTSVIGVAIDVTERRRAEESLRETERQLRQIIDLVPHMIFARDVSGNYLLVNRAIADAYATTVQAITGGNVADWHTVPAEMERFLRDDREVIASGQAKFIAEELFADASGRQRILQTSKIPLAWAGGTETAVLGVSVDITERKQAEEALRQAQKLESLGILAGGVAHDFNNLLVAILGQTSLALVRLSKESPARHSIEKATKAAERAADLTRQLLAYSGRGHFEIQLLKLNTLIQENLHLFEIAVPKNIHLLSELTEPLPLIEADAGQMQQIIMNLILNGAEAVGDIPGTVTVVTGVQGVDITDRRLWQYTGEALTPGQYVSLEVHDSGHGMDQATISKIFDPFFTTKKAGRGLGLAAVLGIVRGHRGGIRVYSEVGKGTTFKVLFPAISQTPTHLLSTATTHEQPAQPGFILIIDDEQSVRETAADILQEEGFGVLSTGDGQSGLEMYREKMADILLVLLDLSMPGISGEETFRQLRQLNPDVRVILSSGYNQIEATRRFIGKGLAGFLQKPYNARQLVSEIKQGILTL